MNPAFLTGSYVYGTPKEESDVDLVVFVGEMPKAHLQILLENADEKGSGSEESQWKITLRFGRLNLILCKNQAQYDAWKEGTFRLKTEQELHGSPRTRDRAIQVFKEERFKRGIIGLLMDQLLGAPGARVSAIRGNVCVPPPIGCGGPASEFTDDISEKEYTISGLCQACQDKVFVGQGK